MPKGQKPLLGVLSKRDGNKKRKQTTTIFSLVFIQSLLISLHSTTTPLAPFFAPSQTNVNPPIIWLTNVWSFFLISLLISDSIVIIVLIRTYKIISCPSLSRVFGFGEIQKIFLFNICVSKLFYSSIVYYLPNI